MRRPCRHPWITLSFGPPGRSWCGRCRDQHGQNARTIASIHVLVKWVGPMLELPCIGEKRSRDMEDKGFFHLHAESLAKKLRWEWSAVLRLLLESVLSDRCCKVVDDFARQLAISGTQLTIWEMKRNLDRSLSMRNWSKQRPCSWWFALAYWSVWHWHVLFLVFVTLWGWQQLSSLC